MNGNLDPNYPEAGSTAAYSGAPGDPATEPNANSTGSYSASGAEYRATGSGSGSGYGAAGAEQAGSSDAYNAAGYPPPPPGYTPPPGYAPPYAPGYGYPGSPQPPVPGAPNPGLAILLGFIPGVGAMYNGQFAKGIAQIVIFSILTSLSSHAHDPLDVIFGLLTAGWYFYMVFDSYQTARARRDGLVLPDPFGLNNIGERFGMPGNPNWGDFVARPATPADPGAPQAPPVAGEGYAAPGYTSASAYSAPGSPYAAPASPYAAPACVLWCPGCVLSATGLRVCAPVCGLPTTRFGLCAPGLALWRKLPRQRALSGHLPAKRLRTQPRRHASHAAGHHLRNSGRCDLAHRPRRPRPGRHPGPQLSTGAATSSALPPASWWVLCCSFSRPRSRASCTSPAPRYTAGACCTRPASALSSC